MTDVPVRTRRESRGTVQRGDKATGGQSSGKAAASSGERLQETSALPAP